MGTKLSYVDLALALTACDAAVVDLQARLAAAERAKEVMAQVLGETSDRLSDATARAERLAAKIEEAKTGCVGLLAIMELAKSWGLTPEEILVKLSEALAELGKELDAALSPEAPLDRAAGGDPGQARDAQGA